VATVLSVTQQNSCILTFNIFERLGECDFYFWVSSSGADTHGLERVSPRPGGRYRQIQTNKLHEYCHLPFYLFGLRVLVLDLHSRFDGTILGVTDAPMSLIRSLKASPLSCSMFLDSSFLPPRGKVDSR